MRSLWFCEAGVSLIVSLERVGIHIFFMILLANVNHMQKASGYIAALSLDQIH